MVIHVITNVHNEILLMPYFLRHYASFADRIFIYDAMSDDGTREVVAACPKAELIDWQCHEANDMEYMALHNSAYIQHSRGVADWVILPDCDEFVYHPEIRTVLEEYKQVGINLAAPQGYNMMSDQFPTTEGQIYEEVVFGTPYEPECKPIVFDPMLPMNFGIGKHGLFPFPPEVTVIEAPMRDLKLLHLTGLGRQFRIDRLAARARRLSQTNIDNGWGLYVLRTAEEIGEEYDNSWAGVVRVID